MSDRTAPIELSAGAVDPRSAIAPTLASTLPLRDVYPRRVRRPAIPPFERMGIWLLEADEAIRVFVMASEGAVDFAEHVGSRRQFADRLWPSSGRPVCIRSARGAGFYLI